MKISIEITGVTPLLMHDIKAANPLHPLAQASKRVSSDRTYKKTEEGIAELQRIDFLAGLYYDEALGPYLPAENIQRSFIDGGRVTKHGKAVERGLLLLDDAPLLYKGPRTPDEMWESGDFTDVRMVRVGQSRVPRCRPIFREWAVSIEGELDTEILDLAEFRRIGERAGRMSGIGDFRPRFGRYEVIVDEI